MSDRRNSRCIYPYSYVAQTLISPGGWQPLILNAIAGAQLGRPPNGRATSSVYNKRLNIRIYTILSRDDAFNVHCNVRFVVIRRASSESPWFMLDEAGTPGYIATYDLSTVENKVQPLAYNSFKAGSPESAQTQILYDQTWTPYPFGSHFPRWGSTIGPWRADDYSADSPYGYPRLVPIDSDPSNRLAIIRQASRMRVQGWNFVTTASGVTIPPYPAGYPGSVTPAAVEVAEEPTVVTSLRMPRLAEQPLDTVDPPIPAYLPEIGETGPVMDWKTGEYDEQGQPILNRQEWTTQQKTSHFSIDIPLDFETEYDKYSMSFPKPLQDQIWLYVISDANIGAERNRPLTLGITSTLWFHEIRT